MEPMLIPIPALLGASGVSSGLARQHQDTPPLPSRNSELITPAVCHCLRGKKSNHKIRHIARTEPNNYKPKTQASIMKPPAKHRQIWNNNQRPKSNNDKRGERGEHHNENFRAG